MSIVFHCDGCGHKFRVDPGMAGKRFRCKQCRHVATVPSGDDAPRAAAPGFDPFGLEEKPAPRAKRSNDGDGLLGEPLVAETCRPSPVAAAADGEVNPTRGVPVVRRKLREFAEAPVLGVPVEHAPWAFLAALVLLDPVRVLFGMGFSRWALAVALVGLVLVFVGVALNALVILLASRVCDAEVSSVRRVVGIALALAVGSSLTTNALRMASIHSPMAGAALNLLVSGSILAATLQLGCFGVIGFLLVECAIYVGLSVFLYSVLLNL